MSTLAARTAMAGVCALVLALDADAHAQVPASATISMTASSTTVPVGGTFRLEINVSTTGGEAPDPELPDLSAFEILSRQVFRPMSVHLGTGAGTTVITSSIRVNFVLRAIREGRVALTPARVRIGSREHRSNPLTIDVVGGGSAPVAGGNPGAPSPGTPPAASPGPPDGVLDGAVYDDQVFLRTVVDRGEAFVGEQVTVTVYVYIRGRLTDNLALTHEPSADGFWTFNLLPRDQPPQETVQIVGGMQFHVFTVRRFAAFPISAGEHTIGAPTTVISRSSPIDIFMGTPQPDIERTGVPVTVTVRDLPTEGRPTGVSTSHVGTLNVEATLDRNQVPTGDAVTLTVTASGAGHLEGLDLGTFAVDGLRVLSPQVDAETSAPGDRVSGTRRVQWLIVPEREGTYVIPSFRVAVFDAATETWSLAETAPLTLLAAGNPVGGVSATPDTSPAVDDGGEVPVELGPVRNESALARRRTRLASQPWFPWTALGMPAALGLVLGFRMLRGRKKVEDRSPQRTAREARKRLDGAAAAASKSDTRGFYAAVTLALRSVVEGKLGESVGSLTHPQLRQRLVERGMTPELAKSLVDELESCEYARFSTSGGAGGEMDACLGRARTLLGELERFAPTDEAD